MPSQRITPGTSTLVIRLVDHELSDDGDGGDGGGDVGDRGHGGAYLIFVNFSTPLHY